MNFKYSMVVLAPNAEIQALNDFGNANNFVFGTGNPLSADGSGPDTDRGYLFGADQTIVDGFDAGDPVLDRVTWDYCPDDPGNNKQHYEDMLTANNLQPVVVPEEPAAKKGKKKKG